LDPPRDSRSIIKKSARVCVGGGKSYNWIALSLQIKELKPNDVLQNKNRIKYKNLWFVLRSVLTLGCAFGFNLETVSSINYFHTFKFHNFSY